MSAIVTPLAPAGATTTPPAPSTSSITPPAQLQPYRWTIAAYRKLALTGLFDGLKTMLLHGEVYVMPMPDLPHDVSLGLVDDWLRSVFATNNHVRTQMGFDVGTDNDPGPDIAVVSGIRRDYTGHPPTTALLVVEVAFSSLSVDMTEKAELYATAGVQDYWVIDIEHRQLHMFRDPQSLAVGLGATAYRTHLTLAPADRVSPLAAPTASILVSDLLP
jgi:Uma2 family endonuclease